MKNEILKIGYFADGPWSHEAFRLLILDPTIKIQFIVPRSDTTDNTLKDFSEKYNIELFSTPNINSKDFLSQIEKYECDLFVSMSFNQIFKKAIINIPPHKIINCHAGKLPFYRGRNILNWALINDEKEFGITIHYVDEGIDTGDIILQRCYAISEQDDYKTLLECAYINCARDLYDAVKLIQTGNIRPIKQTSIHPVGHYCGMRRVGAEIINWNQSSREVFNFIRAICSPGPKARTMLEGKEVKINRSRMIPNAPIYKCTTGLIVGKSMNGYVVKTQDSTVEISEIEYEGKIRIGDRFM